MLTFLVHAFLSLSALCDYNGILGTGQSLSVGLMAGGNYTNTQPFKNLKLSLGSKEKQWPLSPTDSEFQLVALTEPLRATVTGISAPYPGNIFGETPHSAMANHLTSLESSLVTVHSCVGESGQPMSKIKKGATDDGKSGRAYNASLFEVQTLTNLAEKEGKTYCVTAIIFTDGDTDNMNPTYQSEILQLYQNYTADVKAITRQSEDPIFILSQQHSFGEDAITTKSSIATWKVMDDAPGAIFCSGPRYQYHHSSEGIHFIAQGYDALGEKYAEVYYEAVVKGNRNWRPLEPKSATRIGNSSTINVTFGVPNPPLQWDSVFPSPAAKSQWRNGRGFELSVDNNPIEISSAEISGSSVLVIASEDLPSGSITVGYAATSQTKRPNGTTRWGLLRDADPMVGFRSRTAQPNWALSFEIPVS